VRRYSTGSPSACMANISSSGKGSAWLRSSMAASSASFQYSRWTCHVPSAMRTAKAASASTERRTPGPRRFLPEAVSATINAALRSLVAVLERNQQPLAHPQAGQAQRSSHGQPDQRLQPDRRRIVDLEPHGEADDDKADDHDDEDCRPIARVGEGIVSTIGSAVNHLAVLENPDNISRVVLEKGLDAGTAYEILSIDIADMDVGENIGAKLQVHQATADEKRFQAEAEKRRAMAVAQEAEYKAEVQKNRAVVILAEAEIPKAMADAFRSGNMGIMDFERLRNIQSDTTMRSSIAGDDPQQPDKR